MARPPVSIVEGVTLWSGYFTREQQEVLVRDLRVAVRQAPLYQPVMPRTGQPFSVRMTNLGELGWVSDRRGYRYQKTHPVTGAPWPPIFPALLSLWSEVTGLDEPPEACLVNYYNAEARMGLHQDRDEKEPNAPVVSVSLGDSCRFRVGGLARTDPTRSVILHSGDVLTFGGPARFILHGVDRLLPGTSTLLEGGGRINLTLRRVTPFEHATTGQGPS